MKKIIWLFFLPFLISATYTPNPLPVSQSGTWDEVGINDSGNSITVDGTVTVTDGAGSLNVIIDSGTTAVTQGTATSLKTQIFGDDTTQAIDTDASGQLQIDVLTLPSVTIGTFPDNEPINVTQLGGATINLGSGAISTGTARVTIGTDDEINDDLDAIRISSAAIDTDTTTIIGHVDGVEALLGTIDTDTGNIDTSLNNIEASASVMDDWDNAASDGASVSGDVAHDTADAGEPVKIGGKATDYQPDTEDAQGAAEVTANDRVNAAYNLRGEAIEGVNSLYHLFDGTFPDTGLDGVYDDSPTSSTSEGVEAWNYRHAQVGLCIDSTSAPTDIQIQVQESVDNTVWFDAKNGALGQWIYDDTYTATEKCVSYSFDIATQYVRVKITCTGTDATNTFTVDDSFIYLRN